MYSTNGRQPYEHPYVQSCQDEKTNEINIKYTAIQILNRGTCLYKINNPVKKNISNGQ